MSSCPNSHGNLKKINRSGVEIEYCPVCGGVWLDRGELEILLEKSAQFYSDDDSMAPQIPTEESLHKVKSYDVEHPSLHDKYHPNHNSQTRHSAQSKKKKEGFLDDLFDFDFFG